MPRSPSRLLLLAGFAAAAAACTDRNPAGLRESPSETVPPPVHAALQCRIDVRAEMLACAPPAPETAPGVSPLIIGGQGTNVRLASSGTSYDSATSTFRTNVTVENLMAQALGTTDGAFPAPGGVRVFFHSAPAATGGTGEVAVANADGEEMFTAAAQKYFRYAGLLAPGDTTVPREWRFSVPSTVTHFSFTVFVAAAVPGPEAPQAGIVLLAGYDRADTVGAVQGTRLRIGVRGPDGSPAANTLVRVKSVRVTAAPFGVEVETAAIGAPFFTDSAVGMTDAQGTFSAWVRMGRRAGPGRLVVTVPDLSLSDTARYTILPGRATTVRSFPRDTTVLMGSRVPLRVATSDRYANVRNDTATLMVSAGPGSLEGNEVVAGSSIGRVTAVASVGGIRDSSYVRVVPPGSVAATTWSAHTGQTAGIYTFSFPASDTRLIRSMSAGAGMGGEMSLAWLTPTKLVYSDFNRDYTKPLNVVDLETGENARFLQGAGGQEETTPRVSADGKWVYFSSGNLWLRSLYRALADGTGKEPIEPAVPWGDSEWGADPSPDGTRIVFVRDFAGHDDDELFVMDLATRQLVRLGIRGVSPRWSPDGTRIAYAGEPERDSENSGMRPPMIVNADGTGARRLSTAYLSGDVNWSPDGKYVVAATNRNYELLIVDVAAGTEVRFVHPGIEQAMVSLVWKP
jgi:hypothetical protein